MKLWNKINFAGFCTLFFANGVYAGGCGDIDQYVKNLMLQQKITGMAIAIVAPQKVYYCNYGYANKNKQIKITEKSIFEIASLTKTFTALLAGIAVSNNKLDLDAPITRYIPELITNKSYTKINNKELLTHVSGLPLGFNKDFTESELIHSAINMKFTVAPSHYYQYSNPGLTFSGIALTRIYNMSYQALLDKLILSLLGMRYTSINVAPQYRDLTVTGYDKHGKAVNFINIGVEDPAGGLKSNTYDLAKYLQLQLNPSPSGFTQALAIVHKNYYCLYEDGTYQQLAWEYYPPTDLFTKFQPDLNNRNITLPHTLPVNCQTTENGFIQKTGNFPGTTSYMAYLPNKKIGVVILANAALKPQVVDLGRYVLRKQAS